MKKVYQFLSLLCILAVMTCFTMSKGYAQCNPFEVTDTTVFTEDFTGTQAVDSLQLQGVMPSCWGRIYTGAAAGYDPKVFNGTTAIASGNNCLAISSGLKVTLTSISSVLPQIMTSGFNPGDYIDTAGTVNYVILPKISNNLNDLLLSFTSKMTSDSIGTLEIGYFTDTVSNIDSIDLNTFVALTTITNTTTATTQNITLGNYLNEDINYNLVFRWMDTTSIDTTGLGSLSMSNAATILMPLINRFSGFSTCYIDNINIQRAPTCLVPSNITVSNITESSAQISWTVADTAQTQWEISYNDSVAIATTNPYTLTNLSTNVSYEVKVRAICTDENSVWAGPVTFSTTCPSITVTYEDPFTEDFTGLQAVDSLDMGGIVPDCWNRIYTGAAAGFEPKVFNGTDAVTSGDNCLAISAGLQVSGFDLMSFNFNNISIDSVGRSNYVILPKFDNNLNELQVVFNSKMSSDSTGTLEIGYFANANNVASFVTLDSVSNTVASTNHIITLGDNLDSVGVVANIVFRWSADASFNLSGLGSIFGGGGMPDLSSLSSGMSAATCYIDNIVVRVASNCTEPSDVTVSNISDVSAQINWVADPSQNLWEISYDTVVINVTANPYTITGLTSTTQYEVSVRAICTDENSYWSSPVTFTTACPAITVTDETPYTDGFEGTDLGCWLAEVVEGADNWQQSPDAVHNGRLGVAYSCSVFGDLTNMTNPLDMLDMMNNMTNFGNGSARLTSPILDLTAITGQVKLSFYRKQSTMMIPQNMYIFYRTTPTAQWTLVQYFNTTTADWTGESVVLPNPSATYQISFLSVCDINSMGSIDPTSMMTDPNAAANFASTIFIDDIRIGLGIDCDDPANITFSNVTNTTATVTWEGSADSWSVEYGEAGFTQGSGTTVPAQTNTYTFTDLTPNTAYDVYIRANCADDNFSEWVHGNFTTGGTAVSENGNVRLTIAPNPTNGLVRCTLNSNLSNARLQVLDVYGKLLMETTVSGQTTELNFSDKASGVYFLRVIDGNSVVTTQKVIRR